MPAYWRSILSDGQVLISDLQVAPEHRRHGVANTLIRAALRAAAMHGKSAVLEASPGRDSISPQALVAMYQKLGFRQVSLSPRGNPLMEFGPAAVQSRNAIAKSPL